MIGNETGGHHEALYGINRGSGESLTTADVTETTDVTPLMASRLLGALGMQGTDERQGVF